MNKTIFSSFLVPSFSLTLYVPRTLSAHTPSHTPAPAPALAPAPASTLLLLLLLYCSLEVLRFFNCRCRRSSLAVGIWSACVSAAMPCPPCAWMAASASAAAAPYIYVIKVFALRVKLMNWSMGPLRVGVVVRVSRGLIPWVIWSTACTCADIHRALAYLDVIGSIILDGVGNEVPRA
jgi:hypothetical protein